MRKDIKRSARNGQGGYVKNKKGEIEKGRKGEIGLMCVKKENEAKVKKESYRKKKET